MPENYKKFYPITKVTDVVDDQGNVHCLVYGPVAVEELDKSGEIWDYANSKPYWEAWSGGIFKASGGKSYGNCREMHTDSAVGIAKELTFNDGDKAIFALTEVIDPLAAEKCRTGVYTGYSQGGSYVKRTKVPEGTLYVSAPAEYSLVDNPCAPSATFEYVKADGSHELRKFAQAPSAAAAQEGVIVKETVEKSMYTISELASVILGLKWVHDDLFWDCQDGGEPTPATDQVKASLLQLIEALNTLTGEESEKLKEKIASKATMVPISIAMDQTALEKYVAAAKAGALVDLAKLGAKFSAATKEAVGKTNAALADMGKCFGKSCDHTDFGKCFGAMGEAHKAAGAAMSYFDDNKEDQEKETSKASSSDPVSKIQPEEDPMKETELNDLNKAASDSAAALQKADATEAAVTKLATDLPGMIEKAVTDALAKTSAGARASAAPAEGTLAVVTKAAENGAPKVVVADPTNLDPINQREVTKSLLAQPMDLSKITAISRT